MTHQYASNLQQFWLAFQKMVKRRVVQADALLEALHKPKWVKMMNRSVLNVHQSRKTILKRITTVGIVDSWKDARELEKEWLAAGKKGHDFHLIFYTELVGIWLMVCGETPFFNLDKHDKLSTLFHGTAVQSFRSLVHAMGFNMATYPYYESGERVLKPWIRSLSEGAGNGLLFDYVEEHEAGILPVDRENAQHGVEPNDNDSVNEVDYGESAVDHESVGSANDDHTMRDVIIESGPVIPAVVVVESDPVLPGVVVLENNVPPLSALEIEENANKEIDTSC